MKAFVDKDTCIGCGLCCEICEAVFRMDASGKAEAVPEAAAENMEDARGAAESCPVAAITIED